MNLNDFIIDKKSIKKIERKRNANFQIAEFYKSMAEKTGSDRYEKLASEINGCCEFWNINYYVQQGIKDIKTINRCKNRFCVNCQAVLAMARYNKYKNELTKLSNDYTILHVVFTVPNSTAENLISTLNKMLNAFPYLIRYLKGTRKCKFINFEQYCFAGGIRALEITTKKRNGVTEFHPHFHCLFLVAKSYNEPKEFSNVFSYDVIHMRKRKFSKLEIILQNLWYMLYNGIKFNEKNYLSLENGYSVIADKTQPGKYKEVFKYPLKGTFKNNSIFYYDNFELLYHALYKRKIIQGYGILNKFTFDDEEELENISDEEYFTLLRELSNIEDYVDIWQTYNEVNADADKSDIQYISRNIIKSNIRAKL